MALCNGLSGSEATEYSGVCTLMQNYMQDKRSEYFFWILILIELIMAFTSKKYLNFYKIKYENS